MVKINVANKYINNKHIHEGRRDDEKLKQILIQYILKQIS